MRADATENKYAEFGHDGLHFERHEDWSQAGVVCCER